MAFLKSLLAPNQRIDFRIDSVIGKRLKKRLVVHASELPAYRFVDLYNAFEGFFQAREGVERIETEQQEPLNQLLHGSPPHWANRSARGAKKVAWQVGPKEDMYLPIDCFWLCPSPEPGSCFVARLKFEDFSQKSRLEIACGDTTAGKEALERIIEHSRAHSIYRNKSLHLAYEAGKRDEFGDIEKPERFQVLFSAIEPVTDADIVLSEEHLGLLRRNVIDLYARRDILEANGVPARRGILLHGPPGTGKTFACRYLSHKLVGVTRIFVSGSSLLNVGAIFSFARLLQPAVLFLEDVDLIFASREISLYSTTLGDLLDQMDGLRSRENIAVVLTTNSIDRLEAAIRDRPGRISQCIYMGAPAPDQRRRFIEHQLMRHDASQIDLDRLVADSDGATQAFLKEWVHRAVQIACERLDNATQKAELRQPDFAAAMDEMRRFLDASYGKIIGFVSRK